MNELTEVVFNWVTDTPAARVYECTRSAFIHFIKYRIDKDQDNTITIADNSNVQLGKIYCLESETSTEIKVVRNTDQDSREIFNQLVASILRNTLEKELLASWLTGKELPPRHYS